VSVDQEAIEEAGGPGNSIGTYAGYGDNLPTHQVFLKLRYTSKVSRWELNSVTCSKVFEDFD
jgi:hypothetical protein